MIVRRKGDGMIIAEIGTGVAEGAGTQIKPECNILSALNRGSGECDRLAGTDADTHTAADALVGIVGDSATIVGGSFTGYKGIHVAAGFAEKLGDCFFYKRKIHTLVLPFLFLLLLCCSLCGCIGIGKGCFHVSGLLFLSEYLRGEKEPVHNGLGFRCASGDIHVNMDIFAQRAAHGVTVTEDITALRAGSTGDDASGLRDLLECAKHTGKALLGNRAGNHCDIRMAGAAYQFKSDTFRIIAGRKNRHDLDIAAVAGACIDMEQPGRFTCAFYNGFLKHIRSSFTVRTMPEPG